MPVADLARAILDSPRWVETRELLLRGEAEIFGLAANRRSFVAVSPGEMALIAVVGRPELPFIEAAAQSRPHEGTELLCAEENADYIAAALPGWNRIGADVLRWPDALPLPAAQEGVRLIARPELASLEVPEELRYELGDGSPDGPIVAALDGGRPVAFCYPSATSETLWDVSVDTLELWRRRGFATRAFRHTAFLMGQRGKWPVWGYVDDNDASRELANKLGFVPPAERLVLFRRA